MNCIEVQRKLTDDLDSRFEEEMVSHLTTCSTCRKLVDDLLEMQDLIQVITTSSKIPRHLYADVLDEVVQESHKFSFRNRTVLATVALVVFAAGMIWAGGFGFAEEPVSQPLEVSLDEEIPTFDSDALTGNDYIEIVVEETVDGEVIIRLPSVIEIRKTDLHEDVYINHVSH